LQQQLHANHLAPLSNDSNQNSASGDSSVDYTGLLKIIVRIITPIAIEFKIPELPDYLEAMTA